MRLQTVLAAARPFPLRCRCLYLPVSENEAGVKDLKRREEEVTLALKGCFTRLCGKRRRGLKANERASILYDDREIDVCVHLLVSIKYCQGQVDDHEVRWASLQ